MKGTKLISVLIVIVSFSSTLSMAAAAPGTVFGDPSDGWVSDTGGTNTGFVGLRVGDNWDPGTSHNLIYRNFVKFSLSGVPARIGSARLYLYLYGSTVDGTSYSSGPLPNPGLGNCLVLHVNDYGTIDAADYSATSIGNDPGVLIGSGSTPGVGYISIDIAAALQDDLNNGRAWSTFMIRLATDTDNDGAVDEFKFYSADSSANKPYIEYGLRVVGGVVATGNRLEILTPYVALVGLIAVVSTVYANRGRKD